MVESENGILNRTKLRFVCTELWRAVRAVKGLTMNADCGALDSAPGSQSSECLLTMPTTLYTGFSSIGLEQMPTFLAWGDYARQSSCSRSLARSRSDRSASRRTQYTGSRWDAWESASDIAFSFLEARSTADQAR